MRGFVLATSMVLAGVLLAACDGGDGSNNQGGSGGTGAAGGGGGTGGIDVPQGELGVPIVFVSRQIQEQGSIYWDVPKDMPGIGAHSRVRPAAPGRLVVLETDGTQRVLVDGSQPTDASLHLVDVNGPNVSYDGKTIVFAGLPEGDYDTDPARSTGGWSIFAIEADGTGLRQITYLDGEDPDLSQFGPAAGGLGGFDDYDPVFLPDGRICFSSTRFREYGQYSGVRASNLWVVGADGQGMHRITSERNGADRPLVDPLTGKIVYARWWRNHRFPIDSMETIPEDANDLSKGYKQKDGLTTDRDDPVGGPSMFRNAWQAATIAPDGTGLAMWSGRFRNEEANHVYGGTFTEDGALYASFFPMYNMTEAAGFGGVRRYERGAEAYAPILGVTTLTLDYVHDKDPTSYGIFEGVYASEPEALPDGRIVVSMAADIGQDYGLYVAGADGSELKKILDLAGTSELRARVLAPRKVPPVLPDSLDDPSKPGAPSLPPGESPPFDGAGTFTFDALNVYANAPVDTDIVSAIPVGSGGTIRFFLDHQRKSPGSFPALDWPILLGEKAIAPDGSVQDPKAPAYLPLFEQIRTPMPDYRVPLTGGPDPDGAAHVAGMNFGVPGAVARCVGCHAGHTMIPVPDSDADAKFSNLAPGATVSVSSSRDPDQDGTVVDRRVMKGEIWRMWTSAQDAVDGQWVALTFPVPVTVRTVRLWAPRQGGGETSSSLEIKGATVRLFSDAAGQNEVASEITGQVDGKGTDVPIGDVKARVVRVELDEVAGTFNGMKVAGIAEIEVIARGEAP